MIYSNIHLAFVIKLINIFYYPLTFLEYPHLYCFGICNIFNPLYFNVIIPIPTRENELSARIYIALLSLTVLNAPVDALTTIIIPNTKQQQQQHRHHNKPSRQQQTPIISPFLSGKRSVELNLISRRAVNHLIIFPRKKSPTICIPGLLNPTRARSYIYTHTLTSGESPTQARTVHPLYARALMENLFYAKSRPTAHARPLCAA